MPLASLHATSVQYAHLILDIMHFLCSETGCIKHVNLALNVLKYLYIHLPNVSLKSIGCFPLGYNKSLFSVALDIGVLMWGFNSIQQL